MDLDNKQICNFLSKINTKNAVLSFDLDETLIDLSGNRKEDVCYIYNYAKKLGFKLAIITYRMYSNYSAEYTIEQLKKNNLDHYDFLYLCPNRTIDPWTFKRDSRKNITDKGYHVVMSFGDEFWDIGEYGGIGVKIKKSNDLTLNN